MVFFPPNVGDLIPPTPFSLRLRPYFIASLVILCFLIVGKVIIRDYWGAINMTLMVLMGALVLCGEQGLDATNALLFTVMAVISGIFDTIACILYFQHSKYALYDSEAPRIVIFAQTVFILTPVCLLISATISHWMWADCRDNLESGLPLNTGGQRYYDPTLHNDDPHTATVTSALAATAPPSEARPPVTGHQAFAGRGHRLDD